MAVVVGVAGANSGHLTLDVPERQVFLGLTDEHGDPEGYEHHVLLIKLDGAKWIALDSALTVDRYDLAAEEIIPLPRAGQFPAQGRPFQTLRHITEAEMDQFKVQAMRLADVLGHPGAVAVIAVTTASGFFADPAYPLFPQAVPGMVLQAGNFMPQGSIALVLASASVGLAARWTVSE